jgi:hypothetical protein
MHSPLSTIVAPTLAVLLLFALPNVALGKSKRNPRKIQEDEEPRSDMSLKIDDASPKIVPDRQAKHRRLKKKRASGQ